MPTAKQVAIGGGLVVLYLWWSRRATPCDGYDSAGNPIPCFVRRPVSLFGTTLNGMFLKTDQLYLGDNPTYDHPPDKFPLYTGYTSDRHGYNGISDAQASDYYNTVAQYGAGDMMAKLDADGAGLRATADTIMGHSLAAAWELRHFGSHIGRVWRMGQLLATVPPMPRTGFWAGVAGEPGAIWDAVSGKVAPLLEAKLKQAGSEVWGKVEGGLEDLYSKASAEVQNYYDQLSAEGKKLVEQCTKDQKSFSACVQMASTVAGG